METLGVLLLAVSVSAAAAAVGAAVGAYLGRATAIDARMAPMQTAIETLADQFTHATRRWNKRDRDSGESDSDEVARRRKRLLQIQRAVASRRAGD